MDWVPKLFEDRRFLIYIAKLSLIFGPGFLALGYFERNVFLQLDWLKLLMFCTLFSIVYAMPTVFFVWLLVSVPELRMKRRFRLLLRGTNSTREEVNQSMQTAVELRSKTNDPKVLRQISKIEDQVIMSRQNLDIIDERTQKAAEDLAANSTPVLQFLFDAWLVFFELFAVTLLFVGIDYLGIAHVVLKQLLVILFWAFIIISPLIAIGIGFIMNRQALASKRYQQLTLLFVGFLILLSCFLVLKLEPSLLPIK